MDTAGEKNNHIQSDSCIGGPAAEYGSSNGTVNQALQSYLRQLGDIPRLTPEEQTALTGSILQTENDWRLQLCKFAVTARFVLDTLNRKNPGSWRDLMIPSSLQNNPTPEDFQQWQELINHLANDLRELFLAQKYDEVPAAREKLAAELMRYKFSSDILMQCHDQLIAAARNCQNTSPDTLADDDCCTLQEFEERLKNVETARQKLFDLRQKMIEVNLRLVVRIVNQYSYRNLSVADLVQEGNIGLMRSLEKFDFNLNHKFSTYASWWIRQSIGRAIAEQFRIIRIPTHMVSTIAAINRVEQRFILEHDRMPEISEIAALLDMPTARISAIRKMARQTISLQSPLSTDEDGFSLEDTIPDEQTLDPSHNVSEDTVKKQLMKLLSTLSEREQQILCMRFGLQGEKVHTLQELSSYFKISRERVRQLEMQTLDKLRTPENLKTLDFHKD